MGSVSREGVLFAILTASALLNKCFPAMGESAFNLHENDPPFIVVESFAVDIKASQSVEP